MKRSIKFTITAAIAALVTFSGIAASAAVFEQLDLNEWSINGTRVYSTAAQINTLTNASFPAASATLGTAAVQTNLTVGGNSVLGNASNDVLSIAGDTTISNSLAVGRNATVGGTLGVTGVPTFAASNVVFSGTAVDGGSVTQLTVSAFLKIQANGTNYLIKMFLPTGP